MDFAYYFTRYASITATITLAQQSYNQFVPERIRNCIQEKIIEWFGKQKYLDYNTFTLLIPQYLSDEGSYGHPNVMYKACELYLTNKFRSTTTCLEGRRKTLEDTISYVLAQGEDFIEHVVLNDDINSNNINNVQVKLHWKYCCKKDKEEDNEIKKSFELSFDPKYKDMVLDRYLPLVVAKKYETMIEMKKEIFLYTYDIKLSRPWHAVKFQHPFTFDALALDPELKKSIVDDLDMFIKRKAFYKRVGRAWKRGYLLYGPPGTGKSSLIAAIANYLKFSIYDLQLGDINDDFTLRKLMMSIDNKSILVIEDVDCTLGLSRGAAPPSKGCHAYDDDNDSYSSYDHDDDDDDNDSYSSYDDDDDDDDNDYYSGSEEDDDSDAGDNNINQEITEKAIKNPMQSFSLSGVLNFLDGLWSTCGDERIIILTTNYKERLDPALLRPGRMDMHIHMSYLRMPGFRILASNYLCLTEDHHLFKKIEELLKITSVSPAEVAEELIRSEDPDVALAGVVKMLQKKNSDQSPQNKKRKYKRVTRKGIKKGLKVNNNVKSHKRIRSRK